MESILVTGGAGFIGSEVVRKLVLEYRNSMIVCADSLTYAGNIENLKDVLGEDNFTFELVDINDSLSVEIIFKKYGFSKIIHLAAESHVDRSIEDPLIFAKTNIMGTLNLLENARKFWNSDFSNKLFYHISTDEVYGTLGTDGLFTEETSYSPNSPYSASKASSDHFVRAYHETYKLPVIISNCSNNYGPYQFPEKLIPLFIKNILENKKLPVYGDGNYTRDWLYVKDHANAIYLILDKGEIGETYNIGGHNEWKNIDLVKLLCKQMDEVLGREPGESEGLITFIKDRPGHDLRYAIDATKIAKELGWMPTVNFEQGLKETIYWYLNNNEWLNNISTGKYLELNSNFEF